MINEISLKDYEKEMQEEKYEAIYKDIVNKSIELVKEIGKVKEFELPEVEDDITLFYSIKCYFEEKVNYWKSVIELMKELLEWKYDDRFIAPTEKDKLKLIISPYNRAVRTLNEYKEIKKEIEAKSYEIILEERKEKVIRLYIEMLEYKNKPYNKNWDIEEFTPVMAHYYSSYYHEFFSLRNAMLGNHIRNYYEEELIRLDDVERIMSIDEDYRILLSTDKLEGVYEELSSEYKNRYKILRELVSFNTIQDKENKKIIDYIEKILTAKGFKTEYKEKNLIMTYGENPSFGFLGHTDTVEYTEGWNTNPFILKEKGNKLYGLGACDMKGGIAAILEAVLETDFSKIKNGIKLYFTYDEEREFSGIRSIINNKEKFPNFMVFGEPTNNEVLIGCKGLLVCDLHFKGVKAHSSNPEKGKSANLNAVRFLGELEQFYLKNIKKQINSHYEIPYTTMNVGVLKGGSAKNSIPAECYATLDFRIVELEHSKAILNKIEELCKKYNCRCDVVERIEPFINNVDYENEGKTANFMTEASFVNCESKIILGVGPVTAHEVNEYIEKSSYDRLVEQYKELIKRFS